jgi:hypothetical protein
MSAISFLAGMGAGYIKAKDKALENERQAARDKREQDTFDMKKAEYDQAKTDKDELRQAAAPVTVTPEQGPPTEAQHVQAKLEDRQPDSIGYRVGNGRNAQMFASQGVADAAAKPMQTPEAQRTRMADLAAQGNAFASTALRDSVQTDAAMGQLKEQKELQAHREYARAAAGSFQQGGWKGFSKFATEKYNDGNTYAATEDGKGGAIIVVTDKDGKETDRTAFASPEEAIVFAVSRGDPMKWVDYKTHAADKKAERADKERDFELKEGALKVQQQDADTNKQYRKDLIAERRAMTAARLATGGAGGGAGGGTVEAPYWSKAADEHIVKLNSSKNQDTGREELDGNGAQFMQAVALDAARKNGGNTVAAISRAAEVDAALKVMAKGDANMLVQLRSKALADATKKVSAPPATAAVPQPINTPVAGTRAGVVTPPAPAVQPVQQQKPPSSLDQIQSANMAELGQLAQQYKQATAQFVAALNSGDTKSIGVYMQQKEVLRKQLEQQAAEKFGNGAAAALQKLTAN